MDAALENVYGNTISQDEVSGLMQEIQNEQAMAAGDDVGAVGIGSVSTTDSVKKNEVDQLQGKLNDLKNI